MTHDLTVVIVTYNSEGWIGSCLDALPAAVGGLAAEVIVVDNASRDRSAACAAEHPLRPTVVRNDLNRGFAAAVNQGVHLGSAPWVLLLNPDAAARPGSVEHLVAFARRHPEHGLFGGRAVNPDGTLQISSCWALPTLWSTFCFAVGLAALFMHNPVFDPESMGRWERDSVRRVGMVTGSLLLVSRQLWEDLDGLDERYFVYGEDADFAARALALGYTAVIDPDAVFVHAVGASSPDDGSQLTLLMAGKITYARKNWHGMRSAAGVGLLRLGVLLHSIGSFLTGRAPRWRTVWARRERWWNGFPAVATETVAP